MILETVLGTLISVLLALLVYKIYTLKKLNASLATAFLQEKIDKEAIATKLQQTVDSINNTNLDDKDGFIKFLSQSREWAFSYIENVQASIQELVKASESGDEKRLLIAYQGLMEHLPKEDTNKL